MTLLFNPNLGAKKKERIDLEIFFSFRKIEVLFKFFMQPLDAVNGGLNAILKNLLSSPFAAKVFARKEFHTKIINPKKVLGWLLNQTTTKIAFV